MMSLSLRNGWVWSAFEWLTSVLFLKYVVKITKFGKDISRALLRRLTDRDNDLLHNRKITEIIWTPCWDKNLSFIGPLKNWNIKFIL